MGVPLLGYVCVCVSVCVSGYVQKICASEHACNLRLGMCMFKLLQSDESEISDARKCLFLGNLDSLKNNI